MTRSVDALQGRAAQDGAALARRRGRAGRLAAASAACGLFAIAVLGAGRGGAEAHAVPTGAGRAAGDIVILFVGMAVAVGAVVLWYAVPRVRLHRSKEPPCAPRRLPPSRWGAVALVLAVVALALLTFVVLRVARQGADPWPPGPPALGHAPAARPVTGTPAGRPEADVALLLAGAAAVALLAAFATRRGRPAAGRSLRPPRRRAAAAPARADWPAEPRAAVLAAYQRGESLLAASGLARDPAEAPREFRDRARARAAGDPDALAALTALYERARFSPHPITGAMGHQAREAWARLRDRLEAGA